MLAVVVITHRHHQHLVQATVIRRLLHRIHQRMFPTRLTTEHKHSRDQITRHHLNRLQSSRPSTIRHHPTVSTFPISTFRRSRTQCPSRRPRLQNRRNQRLPSNRHRHRRPRSSRSHQHLRQRLCRRLRTRHPKSQRRSRILSKRLRHRRRHGDDAPHRRSPRVGVRRRRSVRGLHRTSRSLVPRRRIRIRNKN